jgi:hypothetical protein
MKKKLLNEIMGVPKELDPWVESFTELILGKVKNEIKNGWESEGEITYNDPSTGEEIEDTIYKTDKVEISGDKVMDFIMKDNGFTDTKEFMESEMFQALPLWRPRITFDVIGVPSVLLSQHDNTIQAAVGGELNQEFSKIGKINVLPKLHFDFNIAIESEGISDKAISELKETIAHELLHSYQKIKQLKGGKPVHFGRETALNAIANNPYFKELEIEWWSHFLNLIYLHLSFEVNARIEQLYYKLKDRDIKTSDEFLKNLKKTDIWNQMKMLEDFNAEEYLKSFELPQEKGDKRNPLFMLHSAMKQMKYKAMGVDVSSKEEAIKSLINLWDTVLQMGVTNMQSMGVDISMSKVPQKAKEDPYVFFKFFEKRFHKKADIWKRKMFRIGSLISQEKEENTLQKEK